MVPSFFIQLKVDALTAIDIPKMALRVT